MAANENRLLPRPGRHRKIQISACSQRPRRSPILRTWINRIQARKAYGATTARTTKTEHSGPNILRFEKCWSCYLGGLRHASARCSSVCVACARFQPLAILWFTGNPGFEM